MEAEKPGDPPHIAEGPEKGGGAFSAAGSSRLDPCPFTPGPVPFLFLPSSLPHSDFKQDSSE